MEGVAVVCSDCDWGMCLLSGTVDHPRYCPYCPELTRTEVDVEYGTPETTKTDKI